MTISSWHPFVKTIYCPKTGCKSPIGLCIEKSALLLQTLFRSEIQFSEVASHTSRFIRTSQSIRVIWVALTWMQYRSVVIMRLSRFWHSKIQKKSILGEDRFEGVDICDAVEWAAVKHGPYSLRREFARMISYALSPSYPISLAITVLLRLETADIKDTTMLRQKSLSRWIHCNSDKILSETNFRAILRIHP